MTSCGSFPSFFAFSTFIVVVIALTLPEGITAVTDALSLTLEQAQRVFDDIAAKRRVARYLHAPPVLLGLVGSEAGASEASAAEAGASGTTG